MKRKVSLILALLLVFLIAGCQHGTIDDNLGTGTWRYYGHGGK